MWAKWVPPFIVYVSQKMGRVHLVEITKHSLRLRFDFSTDFSSNYFFTMIYFFWLCEKPSKKRRLGLECGLNVSSSFPGCRIDKSGAVLQSSNPDLISLSS